MKFVYNENVGGLQILIVYRVGLQIQHNGGNVTYAWLTRYHLVEKTAHASFRKLKKS